MDVNYVDWGRRGVLNTGSSHFTLALPSAANLLLFYCLSLDHYWNCVSHRLPEMFYNISWITDSWCTVRAHHTGFSPPYTRLYAPGQGRVNHRSLQKISGVKEGGIPRVGFLPLCCSASCSALKERQQELQVASFPPLSLCFGFCDEKAKQQCQMCLVNISWSCMNLFHVFCSTHFRRAQGSPQTSSSKRPAIASFRWKGYCTRALNIGIGKQWTLTTN